MSSVCVLQTDNRDNFMIQTVKNANQIFCKVLGYNYKFIPLQNEKYVNLHPATKKIFIVNKFLQTTTYDIIIFLDTDAWIQNGYYLNELVLKLINNEKIGCFSRDPYHKKNTFINSGSFILKNNDSSKRMYEKIIQDVYNNKEYHNSWPFDQYYISNYIFENKDNFFIFRPDILNTPQGKILRHNWRKNERMLVDLKNLKYEMTPNMSFNFESYYDIQNFPNVDDNAYEYDD